MLRFQEVAPVAFSSAHLEDVVSRRHVGNVEPLAVDVGVIRVVAAGTEALGSVSGHASVRLECQIKDQTSGSLTCVWMVQAKRRRVPGSQDVSSRQKLALCPSATFCPLEMSSRS